MGFSLAIALLLGHAPETLALDISVSMTPDRQVKELERVGFDCTVRSATVECRRNNQIVFLNESQITLQCSEKGACWPQPLAILKNFRSTEPLSRIVPVTIYDSAGSLHLHCRVQIDDRQRQVCIESWHSKFVEPNIRTTAWNDSGKTAFSFNQWD